MADNTYKDAKKIYENIALAKGLYDKTVQEQEAQKRQLKPFQDFFAGAAPAERENLIAEAINNPGVRGETLQKIIEKSLKEVEAMNLESIIDDAPLDKLRNFMYELPPVADAKGFEDVVLYNAALNTLNNIGKAQKEGDSDKVEKLEKNMNAVVASYMLSSDYTDNAELREFIQQKIIPQMSGNFVKRTFGNIVKKAEKYCKDNNNANAIRSYIKIFASKVKDPSEKYGFLELANADRKKVQMQTSDEELLAA
jgi:hypothetical protein